MRGDSFVEARGLIISDKFHYTRSSMWRCKGERWLGEGPDTSKDSSYAIRIGIQSVGLRIMSVRIGLMKEGCGHEAVD